MRTPLLLLLLATACSTEAKTSTGAGTGTDSTEGTGTGTDATTGTGTDTPTGSGTTDAGSTTGGVDVTVENPSAVCEGNPLLPDDLHTPTAGAPMLTAMALGGGKVAVTEIEYEENCGFTLTPVAAVEAGVISIAYETEGEPADCVCLFKVEYTLGGLPPGSWTINSGELSTMVDVT
jgi:hypothetical protein